MSEKKDEKGPPIKKERLSTKAKKRAFLEALRKTLGVIAPAMERAGIAKRTTISDWRAKDPAFARAMEEVAEAELDFAEAALKKQIREGNTTATVFFLKTRGKARGYVERTEVTGRDGKDLQPAPLHIEIIDRREQVERAEEQEPSGVGNEGTDDAGLQ